jgi:CRP-like cAMP-binding protein
MLYLVCFLFRDQILLRSFAIAGDFAYMAYYFTIADQPLWGAIFWNIPNIGINLAMIGLIMRDSRTSNLNDEELLLYRKLDTMTPGDFRKLMKWGKWHTATSDTVLCREGETLQQLHYVLQGPIEVDKSGRKIPVADGMFIGEIAFLKRRPATATVKVASGARFVTWQHDDLEKAQSRSDTFRNAIGAMLNADLVEKVARG